jgi:Zn-dependent metalloprotease
VALLSPVPYALIAGFGALLLPMQMSVRSFGANISVHISPVDAFLLPFCWALLFSSVGVLVGLFGRSWWRAALRILGSWAVPVTSCLRVLPAFLGMTTAVTIASGLSLVGSDVRSFALGGFGQFVEMLVAVLVGLPTLIGAVFLASFGVSMNWQLDALSRSEGSLSSLAGAFALLPLLGVALTLAVGWLAARRSGDDVKESLGNALRAGVLLVAVVWLIGLLTRLDAQAGGLLGFHLAPDTVSLLWHVPLLVVPGCLVGACASVLARGPAARRQLVDVFGATALTSAEPSRTVWLDPLRQGTVKRASASLAFVAVPVMVAVMGSASPSGPPSPKQISYAPIMQAAEQQLKRDSSSPDAVSVTVNPTTREIGTATVQIPLKSVGATPAEPPAEKARAVLNEYGSLFGLSSRPAELGHSRSSTDGLGMSHVYFEQMAAGVPVFGSRIGVHFSPGGKYVTFLDGSVVPDVQVAETAVKLDSEAAIARAAAVLPSGKLVQAPSLQVYAGSGPVISGPNARLAWFVWLVDASGKNSNEYVIDAVNGTVLKVLDKSADARNRLVYNANHGTSLPGTLARSEGEGATGNKDIDNAYDYSGDTYDLYSEWFNRDSYNNNGATLKSTAHYSSGYENAFWNGIQMVYGDGFASAEDVVGHELTHAVTEHTAGLVYEWQSGALNEAFSDVMGETVEWFKNGSTDWLMGAALPIGAIRSLKEPNEYEVLGQPGPKNMSEWYEGCSDNFGVHVNSTIVGHAYYLLASEIGVKAAAHIFYRTLTVYLGPNSTMEDARNSAIQSATDLYGGESTQYNETVSAFNSVGLNGTNQPPAPNCSGGFECAFAVAVESASAGVSPSEAASMLTTLYKARGELAEPSAAGKHFLPLYQGHMGRISELVSEDPTLAETAVSGLAEITPALEALMEGEGDQFRLSKGEMAKIEAALKRLAQDDRLFEGAEAGELADLIEEELQWLNLPSYSGKTYEAGWTRLNSEVEAQTLSEEGGPIIDPNCTGIANGGYPNSFQINGFYVDTPGHRIPGQVSPLDTGGVICGAEVEASEGKSGCIGEESLNTSVTTQLPPGDKVNPSENLTNGSWVGEAVGRAIACAGNETQILYGQAGLLSLGSWNSSQCPETATSCYEGRSTYENSEGSVTGKTYAWVSEGEEEALSFTMSPVHVTTENGYEIQTSFGQFEVKLCGRAGSSATQECGGSGAAWVHRNGEASEPGCPEGNGRFTAQAENLAEETTIPAYSCVQWDAGARMQTVGAPNSLEAVSCVPESTTCIAADSEGDAFYATNVSSASGASWNSWSGPEASPSEAVECPSTSLCLLAAGSVEGGGGNLYHANELGGSFLTSFKPSNGVGAISCPSTSFCVTAQTGGFIRYATNPSGIFWKAVSIGSGTMKDVSCLSSSFCAVVDDSGNVRVATTEAKVKEAGGWTATNVNGEAALEAVACSSTSSCVAVDRSDEVLNLSIEEGGKAGAESQALDGAGGLTDVTCTGSDCVAVDDEGGVFGSEDSGATWQKSLATAGDVTSVSCASAELCASVDTSGDVAMFDPE